MRITTPSSSKKPIEFLSVAAPKVVAGVCTFGLNLALMRHFGVAQFGIFALCSTVILLGDTILGSSLDLAVMRLAPLEHGRDEPLCLALQKAGLYLKIGLGLVYCLGITICAALAGLLREKDEKQVIFATCAAILALLLLHSAQAHAQVAHRFYLFGLIDFLQSTVEFGGIAVLILVGRVSLPLAISFLAVGPLCGFMAWRATAGREFAKALKGHQFELIARLWKHGRWFLITFGLATLLSRLDIFLLSKWSTLSEVGIFSAGQVIAWVPVLVGTYLAVILTPRIMPLARDGKFNAFYRKFQPALLGACVLGYLLSLFAIPLIGPMLLPSTFARSLPIISVLIPGAIAGLASFPLTLNFVMFVRPKFLFTMDCISFPIVVLLFFYAIPRYGAIGAAWVTSATNMARALIAQIMAWQWSQDTEITSPKRLSFEVIK
jgi:O-antigen/teichoic acid export membrane protein